MKGTRRDGFTPADLLAMLAVAGALAALLLPSLRRGRATAARLGCSDNLSRIARAIHGYAATNDGELIRNLQGPQLAGPGDPAHVGGLTLLLPYLEQEELFNRYNFSVHLADPANQDVTQTHLPLFQCTEATPGRRYPLRSSLVNPDWQGAVSDYASIRQHFYPIGPAHDPLGQGALEQNTSRGQVRVYRSMITDGEASTIAHVERAGLPAVRAKGRQVDDGSCVNTMVATEPRGPWTSYSCVTINTYSDDGTKSLPAGPCTINCRNVIGEFSQVGIYGLHPGGVNTSFMDGSVRFLREGMNPYVLFALGSRAGGEVIAPDDF